MRFTEAIDTFIEDMFASAHMTSKRSEARYRATLEAHAEDVDNRDPKLTGREDVKLTLRRWPRPNTQRTSRSILVSFYDWTMEEGIRTTNPARQTRRPKRQPANVYRMTREETRWILAAPKTVLERRAIFLLACAGLRRDEARYLKREHFTDQPGFVHVTTDIAKGGRERFVPVVADLAPVVDEILADVGEGEYVLHAQRWRNPGVNTVRVDLRTRPMSAQALWRMVGEVAKRAGIRAHIHPHLLRHAFGDHVAKSVDLLVAQAMLGHADIGTTRGYVGTVSLDDLTTAAKRLSFTDNLLCPPEPPVPPDKAPTGIEPVYTALQAAA